MWGVGFADGCRPVLFRLVGVCVTTKRSKSWAGICGVCDAFQVSLLCHSSCASRAPLLPPLSLQRVHGCQTMHCSLRAIPSGMKL